MARLKIEAQQEERRAEREAQAAERTLAENKLLLAHELSLKELDIKARQSESSSNGGSIQTGPAGEKKVRIPKNVVPSFVVGDDIDKWLAAYEVALRAHEVPEGQWGTAMWSNVPPLGRDTLLTLDKPDQNTYPLQKAILLAKFGLTPEKYRQRFRDSTKLSTQTWVDFFDFSRKALNGWVRGCKVDDYTGLYHLILREHMLSICFTELRQHLVDSKLTDPRKIAEEADLWTSIRVSKKVSGGIPTKVVRVPIRRKRGEKNLKNKEFSKGPQNSSQGSSGNQSRSDSQKKGFTDHKTGRYVSHCVECNKYGHSEGDSKCPKRAQPPEGGQTPGLASVALGEEMVPVSFGEQTEVTLVSLGDAEMVPKAHMPANTSKYRQWVTINGQRVEALCDTGASMTTVKGQLVSAEQLIPNTFHQVIVADHRNDLEHTTWKEVELRSHLEMLGLPEWVCMTTRSMADREESQGRLEPGTMDQTTAKRRGKGRGKPVPEIPAVVDGVPEEEAPEPTGEDIAALGELPELAGPPGRNSARRR
ncbi:hypothetical protein NDU88_007064 [Pleurodeles waltl]|uniref:Uncharacterized protein n=1 Tax=Pleurodeles waltl TaxID=8319 RepID=A0AAV7QNR4_PLEWA|nr:hypothetical protein NDU88_007064 [Pleurodeles waltl]